MFEIDENSRTRGHKYKLKKKRSRLNIRKCFFTNRVVDTWNCLPEKVVESKDVRQFESRLDKVWEHEEVKFDHTQELSTGTGRQVVLIEDDQLDVDISGRDASVHKKIRHRGHK